MLISDNLFNVSQNFFSPDIVQKFSRSIGQPIDKTKAGLMSVIPTLMNGIVSKGSTPEGAASLVDMANKQNFELSAAPDESKLSAGNEVVNNIFGSNLNSVVSRMGEKTGLNNSTISKMMGLAAPLVMGVIGSKVKNEKMSSTGLMNFLSQQKTTLAGVGSNVGVPGKLSSQNVPWGKIGIAALILLGLWFWWLGSQNKTIVPITTSTPITMTTSAVSDLGGFLRAGDLSQLPKRFRFENLNFATGTVALAAGAEMELDQIAADMKVHPAALVQVQGFTDNVGDIEANKVLSTNRAEVVKQQLVARGVEPQRIEAVGLGSAQPIGSNATAEGRALNRRIEFVVTRIK